jgi:hypothetical protein
MSKASAKESLLGELHAKVAEIMLSALKAHDAKATLAMAALNRARDAEDIEGMVQAITLIPEPNAALLGAITKFLKDNEITCNTDDSESMSALEQRMKAKGDARGLKIADVPVDMSVAN